MEIVNESKNSNTEETIFSVVALEKYCLIIHVQYVSFISNVYVEQNGPILAHNNWMNSGMRYARFVWWRLLKVNHGKIDRLFLTFKIYRYIYYYLSCTNELCLHTKACLFPVGLCNNSYLTGMKSYLKVLREVAFVRVFSTTKKRYWCYLSALLEHIYHLTDSKAVCSR